MPLDGHDYLVRQGWEGKGSGLRHGAISRPIIVAQKKNMGGIGKDRDEAFPFWDHVFNAAANAIKVKCYDSDSEDTESSTPAVVFQKTKTGIISNRRPVTGTPALSGTATPSDDPSASSSGASTPRLSVMAAAKQQAARRMLYSMFFRGPILGADIVEEVKSTVEVVSTEESVEVSITEESSMKKSKKEKGEKSKEKKKRKRGTLAEGDSLDVETSSSTAISQNIPAEPQTSRKKRKVKESTEAKEKKSKRRKLSDERAPEAVDEGKDARRTKRLEKAERKKKKEEKRLRKEEKRRVKEERTSNAVAGDGKEEAQVEVAGEDGSEGRSRVGMNGTGLDEDGHRGGKHREKSASSKTKKKRRSKERAEV